MKEASEMISSKTSTNSQSNGRPKSAAESHFYLRCLCGLPIFSARPGKFSYIRMQLTMSFATLFYFVPCLDEQRFVWTG
jgi:hypothetical protein